MKTDLKNLSWVGAIFFPFKIALDINIIWMQSSLCTPAPLSTTCVHMCVLNLSTFFCACFGVPSRCIWYLSAHFWDFTKRRLVVCYRPFGTAYRFRLQASREWLTFAWPSKMGPIGCPETSEQTTDIQRKISGEERRSRILLFLWIINFACFFIFSSILNLFSFYCFFLIPRELASFIIRRCLLRHILFLHNSTNYMTSSSSSIGTATLVGFGLLNYRWLFSAGRFLQSAVASGTSNPQPGRPVIRTFQLPPTGVPHAWNDANEPQRRKVELWARNCREFCRKWRLPRHFWVLLHVVNLRHGTDGFTSPPKEGVLRIFFARKIQRLRSGLNSRTRVPEASTLTSRPPKPLIIWLLSLILVFRITALVCFR